jgi:hypothetical protein
MGGGTRVSTSESAPWEEQIPYLTAGFDEAKQLYNRGAPPYYSKDTLAGFDPVQTAAQHNVLGYAMGPRAGAMQAGGEAALLRSLGGYTGFTPGQQADLLAGNVRTGPGTPYGAMAGALTGDVIGNLQKNVLPGIRQQQVMYQPGGSSRAALQQDRAVTDAVARGLTKPLAQMYTDAYQTAQGQRLPAASQIIGQQQYGQQAYPSIMSAPLGMYAALGDVGAARRAMTQETINRDMARHQYESTAPQQALQNYMAMVQGNYGGTTTQTTPGPSGLQTIGQIAQIAAPFMALSDIRIKENIEPEGATWKGLQIYAYNYIGDSTPRRGVMAQEVEQVRPDAVATINGIKHVNYGVL